MATVKICDICGKKPVKTFYFPYDSQYNGVETDTLCESFDLCFDHTEYLIAILRGMLSPAGAPAKIVYVENQKIIDCLMNRSKHKK